MDLISDNLSVSDVMPRGGAAIDELGNIAKGIFNDNDKAKLKDALKKVSSGNLNGMTGHQTNLLIRYGISPDIYTQIPEWKLRDAAGKAYALQFFPPPAGTPTYLTASGTTKTSVAEALTVPVDIKKYIPWILGVIVVAALIYFISKK